MKLYLSLTLIFSSFTAFSATEFDFSGAYNCTDIKVWANDGKTQLTSQVKPLELFVSYSENGDLILKNEWGKITLSEVVLNETAAKISGIQRLSNQQYIKTQYTFFADGEEKIMALIEGLIIAQPENQEYGPQAYPFAMECKKSL